MGWGEPARFTAKAFEKKGDLVYIFLFFLVPPSMKEPVHYGSGHGSDIAYVFNNLNARGAAEATSKHVEVAKVMHSYWANFAKSGNPNGKDLLKWPKFDTKKFEIQSNGKAVGKPDPRKKRMDVIDKSGKRRNDIQLCGGI